VTTLAIIAAIDKAIEKHRKRGKPSLYECIAQAAYNLGAKHEREACANIVEMTSEESSCRIAARRIRARSEK
jgi:hypothetical protein